MAYLKYQKHEPVRLKGHPQFNEVWLQDRIAEDPSILGLGELELIDRERIQPRAGRLDLLFRDPDSGKRYEVEIMLGAVDESHIIRTIEYWDIERKRFPQYDHCAVIVAEEITSRFLNVIGLFNNAIPIVAIQLNALRVDDTLLLNFTKVLDEISLGLVEEEEGEVIITDRAYWDARGKDGGLALADKGFDILQEIDPELKPNYTRSYIGVIKNGKVNNFMSFHPKAKHVNIRINKSLDAAAWRQRIEDAGLVLLEMRDPTKFRFNLQVGDFEDNEDLLREMIAEAYQVWFS